LEVLTGQAGVRRGSIRMTDRSGASAVVDLSMAVSINDVIEAINSQSGLGVRASADGDRLVLTDLTGRVDSHLTVAEVGGGRTAADLGLLGSVGSSTMTGTSLVSVSGTTSLGVLNHGLGVGIESGADLRFTLRDGTEFVVDLSGAQSLGDVVIAINNASGNPGDLVASIGVSGKGLDLSDESVGGGALVVASGNGGTAAYDLGILGSAADGELAGDALMGGLNDVLLSRLNGGRGVGRGTISVTDRSGTTSVVDLRGATTIQEVLSAINGASVSANVTAALNSSGNGIVITDHSGGGGNLVIADVEGTTAADLRIAVDDAVSEQRSGDLDRQFMGRNTRLSDLNGGTGVSAGTIRVTDSHGVASVVNLSESGAATLGEVIDAINAASAHVTARINDTGDGLILEDSSGGAGRLKVEDTSGTMAAGLRIAGTAAEGESTLDGTSEVRLTIGAETTLEGLSQAINSAGAKVRASVLNDGSGSSPYRLSLSSQWTGGSGGWMVDLGELGLPMTEMVRGRDAVLRVGDGSAGAAVLITSHSNTVSGVVDKVTLDLVSAAPGTQVSVTVARNMSAGLEALNKFVEQFNTVTSRIAELTRYDAEAMSAAVLQGDGSILSLQNTLYQMVFRKFDGIKGAYQTLSSLGLKIGSGAQLSLDERRFAEAFNSNPEDVLSLLTDTTGGALKHMEDSLRAWTAPGTGRLAIQADRLQSQSDMLGSRISAMDQLLTGKRERLTNNFVALETALASLQSQSQAVQNLAASVESWRDAISKR
jgi:flagellar hook-associated protein 2